MKKRSNESGAVVRRIREKEGKGHACTKWDPV